MTCGAGLCHLHICAEVVQQNDFFVGLGQFVAELFDLLGHLFGRNHVIAEILNHTSQIDFLLRCFLVRLRARIDRHHSDNGPVDLYGTNQKGLVQPDGGSTLHILRGHLPD